MIAKTLWKLLKIKFQIKLLNYKKDEYDPLFRNQENVKFVLEAMFGATNEVYGTSYSSRFDDKKYQFAGKTGTAQVKRITEEARELDLKTSQIPYEDRDHALYIAYGPYKNPRYAVSVIVEHGGAGSVAAAPIAKKLFKYKYDEYTPLFRNQENIKFVLEAMFGSTNEIYGTSYSSRFDDKKYQFAGKTGTAQVRRITAEERELDLDTSEIPYERRDHSLYVAYGPYKNPRYSVSVIVEHGGSGSKTAAPIAKKLFKLIIDRHELREKITNKDLINT